MNEDYELEQRKMETAGFWDEIRYEMSVEADKKGWWGLD